MKKPKEELLKGIIEIQIDDDGNFYCFFPDREVGETMNSYENSADAINKVVALVKELCGKAEINRRLNSCCAQPLTKRRGKVEMSIQRTRGFVPLVIMVVGLAVYFWVVIL
jgi:hypothetical protein